MTRYIQGINRSQVTLLPECLDAQVPVQARVRRVPEPGVGTLASQ